MNIPYSFIDLFCLNHIKYIYNTQYIYNILTMLDTILNK